MLVDIDFHRVYEQVTTSMSDVLGFLNILLRTLAFSIFRWN